jgi:hypothetical protein
MAHAAWQIWKELFVLEGESQQEERTGEYQTVFVFMPQFQ